MKLKPFLFLSFICLFMALNSKVDCRYIELLGEIEAVGGPRSVVLPAVTAEQTDNAIVLTFNKAVGNIEIAISAGDEVVYSAPLNVAGATQFSIYTGDLKSGTYLLEITKAATNGYVYGEFYIE